MVSIPGTIFTNVGPGNMVKVMTKVNMMMKG